MTDRIELLQLIESADSFGDESPKYESLGMIHAERVKFNGSYHTEVGEQFPDYRVEFNIRSAHKVKEHWHVIYNDCEYTITNIIPNIQRGMKTLVCEKINP